MTVISLIKVLHIGLAGSMIDKYLAIDALLFTISAVLSYTSIRNESKSYLEKYADLIFMLGLIGLGICAVFLSFEIL